MIIFLIIMFAISAVFFVLMWREYILDDEINYIFLFMWFVFSLIFGCELAVYLMFMV